MSEERWGVPTTFDGIRFRSRAEARWAAFFSLLEWPWSYEPLDLAGYNPDFSIGFEPFPPLVEVKPAVSLGELAAAQRKVEVSGWGGEALIVGAQPFELKSETPIVGLIAERRTVERESVFEWGQARIFSCISCGNVSVLAEDGSWRCRACGVDGGNSHVGQIRGGIAAKWAEASNRVQWKSS